MAPSPLPHPPSSIPPAREGPGPAQMFRQGAFHALPFLLVILPFGLLFGVVAREAGIDMVQTIGFSVLVLAGASQFTAVQLLADNASAFIVILSGLAVNLRMAMYSASLVPWMRGATPGQKAGLAYMLIDQSYALAITRYERQPNLSLQQRLAYFFGAASLLSPFWIIGTCLGAWAGNAIPDDIALDFAMPITFLAMIAPMLRSPAHLAACFTAILAALLLAGLPSGTGLLIAAPIGMAVGAMVEKRMENRA